MDSQDAARQLRRGIVASDCVDVCDYSLIRSQYSFGCFIHSSATGARGIFVLRDLPNAFSQRNSEQVVPGQLQGTFPLPTHLLHEKIVCHTRLQLQ